WRSVQGRFVDEPGVAVGEADRLVNEVMRDRGYPPDDPQNRMDDLSVEHATVLGNYRTATAIAQRNARGEATTEELRVALVSYRALFADLLGTDPVQSGTVEGRIVEPRRTDTSQGVRR
ncbi:MAG: putative secreted protein, partial [Candidatus Eremiobacteraeota bacterium]|nr:putative secreted protein [Candidatus Eremiobacteraeota bacterium]